MKIWTWLLLNFQTAQREAIWREAAAIAAQNTYMSKTALPGADGGFGGPSSCEYGCGHVLAAEYLRRAGGGG